MNLARLAAHFGSGISAILGVTLGVFVLTHVIPGDPVEVMLGEFAATADRTALAASFGLDKSLGEQLIDYYRALANLDLGSSLFLREPVADLIARRLPATLLLSLCALGIAIALALPLGIAAALRRNKLLDRLAMGISLLGVSLPSFWLGPVLILVFSLQLGWLPVSGNETPSAVILPALTLGSGLAAILARMVRASLLEALTQDYVRTALAKGVPMYLVVIRHALGNALLPVVTVLGLQLGAILGGAVIVETIFAWPGLGSLTVEAIQHRDYPLLQGCVLLIAVVYVLVNSLTDLLYAYLDPRIHFDAAR